MRPEGAVTVGLEWAHAKFLSQSASLVIVVSSLIALRRIATCSDLAEKAQGIRLVAAFLVLLGERQGAPAQGVCRPQGRRHPGERSEEVRALVDAHGLFEQRERPGQVTLAQGEATAPPRGKRTARRMVHCLGDPQPFVPQSSALGERAQLAMACGESSPAGHGWREHISAAPHRGMPWPARSRRNC